MALIQCKECGKEYSSNAKACPKCGNPTEEEKEETIDVNIKNGPTVNVNINEHPKRKWATGKLIISIISMVLIVLGRLLSGVHWASDIIGSIIISITLLKILETYYLSIKKD